MTYEEEQLVIGAAPGCGCITIFLVMLVLMVGLAALVWMKVLS